jgi:hypothetical protein
MTTPTSPRSKRSTRETAPVLLRRRSDGQVEALSSDGTTTYTLRIGAVVRCECKGFQHYGRCRHIAAAVQRFAAMWTPPAQPQPVCLRTTTASIDLLYAPSGPEAA